MAAAAQSIPSIAVSSASPPPSAAAATVVGPSEGQLTSRSLRYHSLFESLSICCPVCKYHYDELPSSRAPFLLSCGHTLCTVCAHAVRANCPECNQAATLFKENFAFKQLISEIKRLAMIGEIQHNTDKQKLTASNASFYAPRANRIGCYGKFVGEIYNEVIKSFSDGGLAVDASASIVYYCDLVNNRVISIKEDEGDHKHCSTFDRDDKIKLEEPRDCAFDNASNTLFVSDSANSRIVALKCDGATGQMKYSFSFGKFGRKGGELDFPYGVATDSNAGLLYVSDRGNRRVSLFSLTDGVYLTSFGGGDMMNSPLGIAVDPANGIVYVVDGAESTVQVWQRKIMNGDFIHNLVYKFGGQGSGEGAGQLKAPTYLCFDSLVQILYVSDCRRKETGDIQAFKSWSTDAKCRLLRSWQLKGNSTPFGIGCDAHSGTIFVAAAKPRGHIQAYQ